MKDGALAGAEAGGERSADAEALNVGAGREMGDVEQRRQHHADGGAGSEHAPLVGPDEAPPSAPTHQFRGAWA